MVGRIMQAAMLSLMASACQAADQPGGTTVASASGKPFVERPVADFSTPWAMDFLPDQPSLALVSEKEGTLWLVNVATGEKSAVPGVPKVHVAGQGGLGDVVVRRGPDGRTRVYLSYVEQEGKVSGAVLGYGYLVGTAPTAPGAKAGYSIQGFKPIWRQQPKVSGDGHFSHRIAFGPDGFLYLTSGDRQKFDPAQDMTGNLGKVLRLTDEGQPAPGNPWASRGGLAAQFWSIGHRNLLGIAFAPDGRLWESEMGPSGGDEVNLILPGKNYGWPKASNGSHYSQMPIPDHKPGDGYEAPKVWWTPSISPGGLLIYSGDKFPAWKGDALVPALSGEALIRLDIDGDKAAKAEKWEMGRRVRAVDQAGDGRLFILEDGGKLVELTPR